MKKTKRRIFSKLIIGLACVIILFMVHVNIKSSSVVPVLMYHAFKAEKDETMPCVSPEAFERQISFFARNGYNIVGPGKVVSYMTKAEKMPPKTAAITIDDGYYDFYEIAYPILKKYNMPATLFMAVDRIGSPGYLEWRHLREMSDHGLITIGSHTMSHPWLPTVSVEDEKLDLELSGSKKALEQGLGKSVDYICYPNGGFNDLVKDRARKAGYKGAFTTNPDKKSDMGDIYAIRRIKMSSSSTSPLIIWGKVNRFYAWFKERR